MADYTDRQTYILSKLGKSMGFTIDQLTNVVYESEIPVNVTFASGSGTYSRSTYSELGSILTNSERETLRQAQLDSQQSLQSLTSAAQSLLGSEVGQSAAAFMTTLGKQISSASISVTDASSARLYASGLYTGDVGTELYVSFTDDLTEDRVRIEDPTGIFISSTNPVMKPLVSLGFVVFPYTPHISISHTAQYNTASLTHSNYNYPFYQSSSTPSINIRGQFAAKNSEDAAYILAVQHFFRSVTKMFYGTDAEAGSPPPVLRLSGYGDYQFSSVPIVITDFSMSLTDDVDYVSVTVEGSSKPTKVAVMQEMSITCMPLYSRKSISTEFGLRNFAAGKLLGSSSRGGFI